MKRDTVPETCHPYGVRKEGGALPLMSYKHVAPTGLKEGLRRCFELQTCRSYGAKDKTFRSTDIR